MNTYLLTWNPKKYEWVNFQKVTIKSQHQKLVEGRWSCGNTKKIQIGDRVFLLRQGSDHPGLIGSGRVTSNSYQDKNFNGLEKLTWYVDVDWDVLLPVDKILPRESLLKSVLTIDHLNARASGCRIDDAVAVKLEKIWTKHTKRPERLATLARTVNTAREGETTEQRVYVRKRDRRLRDQALDASRGVCEVCGVDFSKKLGGKALRVLQVHHKKQLGWSDGKPKLTKSTDLAVVCANCHLLIHLDPKKAMPIETAKAWLSKSW